MPLIKKYDSFDKAEEADVKYWQSLSGEEKLVILEGIRQQYWAFQSEHPPGLQRVYRIIKR